MVLRGEGIGAEGGRQVEEKNQRSGGEKAASLGSAGVLRAHAWHRVPRGFAWEEFDQWLLSFFNLHPLGLWLLI